MPDILIRGTYFPCNGHRVFRIYADGRVESEYTGILLGAAIELPTHGDLIDRDALKHKFCTHCDGYEHDTGACVDGDQDCMDAKIIMTASVIVPSNKEEGE